jgi:hypothetical protein
VGKEENMRTLSAALVVILMGGCVTPQVTTVPAGPVDFKQYKTVKVAVTDEVKTPYSKEGMPMFDGLLRGKLQSLDYSLVDTGADMTLQVKVLAFDPGNRAARTLVGFGAGRAILTYVASFQDSSGKLITELEGGKSYHGMEVADNPLFKTDEGIRMGMIQEAVIQLGQFMKNNGELE